MLFRSESTARLVGHPLALRLDSGPLAELVERLKAALTPTAQAPAAGAGLR